MKRQQGLPATPSQASGLRGGRGQALLEILLAFSILMVVLSAVMFSVTVALNNVQYAKNKNLANSYAQEGMAIIRKKRDSRWADFPAEGIHRYCIDNEGLEPDEILLSANCLRMESEIEAERIFSRDVIFEHNSAACSGGSKATVKVSWTDSKCPAGTGEPLCHSVELITCFSDIDLKQAP